MTPLKKGHSLTSSGESWAPEGHFDCPIPRTGRSQGESGALALSSLPIRICFRRVLDMW